MRMMRSQEKVVRKNCRGPRPPAPLLLGVWVWRCFLHNVLVVSGWEPVLMSRSFRLFCGQKRESHFHGANSVVEHAVYYIYIEAP